MKQTYSEIFNVLKDSYENASSKTLAADSVEEKRMQAIASELYAVSCYGDYILKQAFVQTADGEYLDKHGELRGCVRKDGAAATGNLVFGISSPASEDIVIEQGTFCSKKDDSLIQYYTTAQATIKSGELEVSAPAVSAANGDKYNASSGEINVLVNAPAGVETVTNTDPFTGGTDCETDGAYRCRIAESFRLPVNGYSKSYAENKINSLDYIIDCNVKDSSSSGTVNIVVATNEELTSEKIIEIADAIDYRELFGFTVNVTEAEKLPLTVRIDVWTSDSDDAENLEDEISEIMKTSLDERKIGRSYKLDELREQIFDFDSVKRIEFACDRIINDSIFCPDDGYLYLEELEVNVNEQ